MTAFPGTGGTVAGLRNKRLRREFNPKKEWYDFDDKHFDHTKAPKNAPWDPEMIKKLDRITTKLHTFK